MREGQEKRELRMEINRQVFPCPPGQALLPGGRGAFGRLGNRRPALGEEPSGISA